MFMIKYFYFEVRYKFLYNNHSYQIIPSCEDEALKYLPGLWALHTKYLKNYGLNETLLIRATAYSSKYELDMLFNFYEILDNGKKSYFKTKVVEIK